MIACDILFVFDGHGDAIQWRKGRAHAVPSSAGFGASQDEVDASLDEGGRVRARRRHVAAYQREECMCDVCGRQTARLVGFVVVKRR